MLYMQNISYLPLGSVVNIEGSVKKLMIISRGIVLTINGKQLFFDYGACLYPEGLVDKNLSYFNSNNITRLLFEGCKDEMGMNMSDKINEWFEKNNYEKGDINNFIGKKGGQ